MTHIKGRSGPFSVICSIDRGSQQQLYALAKVSMDDKIATEGLEETHSPPVKKVSDSPIF